MPRLAGVARALSLKIMEEILHLNYQPGTAGWIHRLQSRLQSSQSDTLLKRYSRWKEAGLGEQGLAFATRKAIRYRAATLFSKLLKQLRDDIDSSGELDHLLSGGYVYNPKDHRIFYDICVAFDALYFESRSTYEIAGKFILNFGKTILDKKFTEQTIHQVLKESGQDVDWIDHIRESRILFFHETAPWIALSIHKRHPLECSLVVMKENLHHFDDPNKFITQQQILDSWKGFENAIPTIFDWLAKEIDSFEKK